MRGREGGSEVWEEGEEGEGEEGEGRKNVKKSLKMGGKKKKEHFAMQSAPRREGDKGREGYGREG